MTPVLFNSLALAGTSLFSTLVNLLMNEFEKIIVSHLDNNPYFY